jgi:hypothetical protein
VDKTPAHRRDPVADPDRLAVAGRAGPVRALGVVYDLFRRWQRDGTWARIVTALQARADAAGLITWDVSVDSTVARAHQHAAGSTRTRPRSDPTHRFVRVPKPTYGAASVSVPWIKRWATST